MATAITIQALTSGSATRRQAQHSGSSADAEGIEAEAGGARDRLNASMLAEVLEQVDTGILVCTDQGQIVLANDAGRRELQYGRPLSVDAEGWLLIAGKRDMAAAQCRSALRAAALTQRRDLLALDDGKHRLMAAVTPLGRTPSPWALLLLGRRNPAPDLALELFGKLCDLTQAERSVLAALVGGERVLSVARQRGVKIATVRTQVSALRAKLGVDRMEDLVRMVAGLPPVTGALRAPALVLTTPAPTGHAPGTRPVQASAENAMAA